VVKKGKDLNMKNTGWIWSSSLLGCFILAGCAGTNGGDMYETPTVDYVERLNVNDAPHQESFLNQLAMNYRSYAMYNARTSGHPDVGELFAQKAIGAFSGETPFPESLNNWKIYDENERFAIYNAYNALMDELRNDAVAAQPKLAAEAQAKFDCWISAAASGQDATARECQDRFQTTMEVLGNCDHTVSATMPSYPQAGGVAAATSASETRVIINTPNGTKEERYYPETRRLSATSGVSRSRDGVMIINNVNVPASNNLIQPIPVPAASQVRPVEEKEQVAPIVFNQNIYGGEDNVNGGADTFNISEDNSSPCEKCLASPAVAAETPACNQCQASVERHEYDGYVTREEFIDLMLALRSELAEINARLDNMDNGPASAPISVPVSVQVSTPGNQNAPINLPPLPEQPPIVVNASAVATPAPININNTSSSKTDPVKVDATSASSSKTDPVKVDATSASASKTDPVNVGLSSDVAPSPVSVTTPTPIMPAAAPAQKPEKTIIKVQQIPLEPRQRIMEEIFEIRFDFDKAVIKPEYDSIIRQLAATTQANKNIKVSVVGHTDTAGSNAYNYALGGRRAEAVQKMLIEYGIPASQIIAVSAGEEDLKVPTPNNTPNAANRRVRVVKETQYMEQPKPTPVIVEEYAETDDCENCE